MTWQWSMNMIKVLWCKFQQCLGTFTMLLVEGMSETGLFRHLSDDVSKVVILENQNLIGWSFFSEYLKFYFSFQNSSKKFRKSFIFFWCNCIWIGIVKLSLLREGYFSSAPNVLTTSPKIRHVNKRDVFHLNSLVHDQ